nr:unnamed protein product [Spirometra erinaceieuropaei]
MMAPVTKDGADSVAFAVTNGVKQGCVFASTLFSLVFSAMLIDACRDERHGIRTTYSTDGHPLNSRCMYAGDDFLWCTGYSTTTGGNIQGNMDLFADACHNFGLIINTEKSAALHRPPLNAAYNAPHIDVNGSQLQAVDTYTYLGSTLSCSSKIDDEMGRRISKTAKSSIAFRTLSRIVAVSNSASNLKCT